MLNGVTLAREEDLKAIYELSNSTRGYVKDNRKMEFEDALKKGLIWVYRDGREIRGFICAAVEENKNKVYISDVAVTQEEKFKHKGIGMAMQYALMKYFETAMPAAKGVAG